LSIQVEEVMIDRWSDRNVGNDEGNKAKGEKEMRELKTWEVSPKGGGRDKKNTESDGEFLIYMNSVTRETERRGSCKTC